MLLLFLCCLSVLIQTINGFNQDDILTRVIELEEKQRHHVNSLEGKLEQETKRNNELHERFNQEIEDINAQLRKEKHRNNGLEKKVLALTRLVADMQNTGNGDHPNNTTPTTAGLNDQLLAETIRGNAKVRRQAASGQAFTVYLDHDVTLGASQPVPFNQIITNDGNGYSVHSSAFTCFQSGLYLFIFFIGDNRAGELRVFLEINSSNYVDAVLQPYTNGYDLQGGNAVVTHLQVGDVVTVKAAANSHAAGSSLLRTTTFTGVYLRA